MRIVLALVMAVIACAQEQRAPLKVPAWFAMFDPENEAITEKTVDQISLSYDANRKFLEVVGDYESILGREKAHGLDYEEGELATAPFSTLIPLQCFAF